VGSGHGGVIPHVAAHSPEDAAQLVVMLCQLSLCHSAALPAGFLESLLQMILGRLQTDNSSDYHCDCACSALEINLLWGPKATQCFL